MDIPKSRGYVQLEQFYICNNEVTRLVQPTYRKNLTSEHDPKLDSVRKRRRIGRLETQFC